MLILINSKYGKHIINMNNVNYINFVGEKMNILAVKFKDSNKEDLFYNVENALMEFLPFCNNKEKE